MLMIIILLMLLPASIAAREIRSTIMSVSKNGAGECGPFRLDTLTETPHSQEVRETDLSHETDL